MKLQTEKYVDGNEFSLQDQDGNEIGKIQVPYDVTDDDHSTQELAELIVERFNGFEDLKSENDDLKTKLNALMEKINKWDGIADDILLKLHNAESLLELLTILKKKDY